MRDVSHDAPTAAGTALQRALARLSSLSAAMAAAALIGLVAAQGWQVFARYVLNDSPGWTEPVTLVLLSTAMSLGAAAAVHDGRHFAFTLLADAAPGPLRSLLRLFTEALVAVIGGVLAVWGAVLFSGGADVRAAGVFFPESLPYAPVALGGALMALFALGRVPAAFAPQGRG